MGITKPLGILWGMKTLSTKAIPIDWIKDYIKHINRLDLEYEPNTCDLDDVVKEEMDESGEAYRILITPDHPTPIRCRTHTADPVPYILFDSTAQQKKMARYSEAEAAVTGLYEEKGHLLIRKLFA